jgi:hypothetical protein
VVFNPELNASCHEEAGKIRSEYVLAVRGSVRLRPEGMVNPEIRTGQIEVMAVELEILNEAKTPPFVLDGTAEISENVRLKYRYLDLRRPDIQKNLILRSRVAAATREYFHREGFIEVETPFLTKSTPEGARDYLVPSRVNQGMFYALPQSPQIFKQLLKVSGFDRYFQIVKCFRDEDLRADRQPEFTQIDVEMSFVTEEDIIGIMERMVAHLFRSCLGRELPLPFPRIAYRDAMSRFGKDSPDMRFGLEIRDLTPISEIGLQTLRRDRRRRRVVKAIRVETGPAIEEGSGRAQRFRGPVRRGRAGLGQGHPRRLDLAHLQVPHGRRGAGRQRKDGGPRRGCDPLRRRFAESRFRRPGEPAHPSGEETQHDRPGRPGLHLGDGISPFRLQRNGENGSYRPITPSPPRSWRTFHTSSPTRARSAPAPTTWS